jgi:lysophospholipase L1-like esterase
VAVVALAVLEGAARYMGLGNPLLYYNDAWGGMRPVPNQQVKRFDGATVTIDENGFRSAVPDQPGATRILFLGDSVTFGGSSVDDKELYSEVSADVLRKKGRPVYAMNAGVVSHSMLNQAEIFHGYEGEIDAVVWLFPWGDTNRAFAVAAGLWPARFKPRLALVELLDVFLFKNWERIAHTAPPSKSDYMPGKPSITDEHFQEQLAKRRARNMDAVRTVVDQTQRRGIPMLLGVTPYLKSSGRESMPEEAKAFLDEMAAAGAIIFDAAAATAPAPDDEEIYIDIVHFNTEGHRLLGEALGAKLDEALQPAPATP